ncbi:MAG TPA: 50S ribosomal protein L11 methyltransferase, partial [Oceanipulchritudo sp.]|nr:50S ribosomal protein L11 methyltransferase [Oceanipulchritudo sp.]
LRHPHLANWIFRPADQIEGDFYAAENRRVFSLYAEQERMLADKPRMTFYLEMIKRKIRPGDRVIDLGTGTGILAAFASWQGAAKVYALDHSTIIEDARALARENKIKNVEFVPVHSRKFTTDEPVDVILHEQMGDILFNEDMVANTLDLRDRLLKKGGQILPARFEFFCEPVQLSDQGTVPFIWELNVKGFTFGPLKNKRPEDRDYYHYTTTNTTIVDRFLCQPTPLMTIDLNTLRKSELAMEWSMGLPVVQSGRMDGYAVFFRALVDDDLVLSTNPLETGRAPHWGFSILRVEQLEVHASDVIDMTISAERGWADIDSWCWEQTVYTAEQYRDCMFEGDDAFDEDED